MSERDFPGKAKVTFGIRVPNSGPLASPESIVAKLRGKPNRSATILSGFTTTSRGRKRFTVTHISSGSDDSKTGDSPDFYEAMTTLAYLAGLVRSVRLGIACLVVPCRNPLLAAKANRIPRCFLRRPAGRRPWHRLAVDPQVAGIRSSGVNRKLRGKIADDHIRAMKTIWMSPALDL